MTRATNSNLPIDPLFQFHKLNERGINDAVEIAECFTELKRRLDLLCPTTTREYAITKSKLEEACFYAKKSIANNPANQENTPISSAEQAG